jgi:bacterioferritin-associated ferredoxin
MFHIDRCVCADSSFAELKRLARDEALDFDGLARRTGCTEACGMCRPYVLEMLRTGTTVFTELIVSADDRSRRRRQSKSTA